MKKQIQIQTYLVNANQNKAGIPILISDRADSREGKLSGTRRGITQLKRANTPRRHNNPWVQAPNKKVSNHMRQKLILQQGEIDKSTS